MPPSEDPYDPPLGVDPAYDPAVDMEPLIPDEEIGSIAGLRPDEQAALDRAAVKLGLTGRGRAELIRTGYDDASPEVGPGPELAAVAAMFSEPEDAPPSDLPVEPADAPVPAVEPEPVPDTPEPPSDPETPTSPAPDPKMAKRPRATHAEMDALREQLDAVQEQRLMLEDRCGELMGQVQTLTARLSGLDGEVERRVREATGAHAVHQGAVRVELAAMCLRLGVTLEHLATAGQLLNTQRAAEARPQFRQGMDPGFPATRADGPSHTYVIGNNPVMYAPVVDIPIDGPPEGACIVCGQGEGLHVDGCEAAIPPN